MSTAGATLSERLVAWASQLRPDELPVPVERRMVRHVLDGIGDALAASRTGVVAPITVVATGLQGPEEAAILGRRGRIAAPAAALANGALIHGLDFDDTHADALVHPTAVVLPTALAVGEEVGASGAAVVTAAAVGYEVVLRLGAAVRHGFHRRGFHATSVVGVFGAALTAARLYGLDEGATVAALGLAGSQAAGSLEFLASGGSSKQLHPGWAGLSGILAARLARAGMGGPAAILEGEAGLFRAYADRDVDPEEVVADLGSRWELDRITLKPYPVCQLSHATLDALREVVVAEPLHATDVATIVVDLPGESVPIVAPDGAGGVAPVTPYEAKFDLRWCLAHLLLEGRLPIEAFAADQLGRPDVLALSARVHVRATDPGVAAAAAPGRVEITTLAGRRVVGQVPCSSGGPDRPLSDDALHAKFHDNCGGRSAESEDLALVIDHLASSECLHGLFAAAALASPSTPEPR